MCYADQVSRYSLFRLLFLALGIAAPVLATAPLVETLSPRSAFLLIFPLVLVAIILSLTMFFGWQGGVLGAVFSSGVFAAVMLQLIAEPELSTGIAIAAWGLFFFAIGISSGFLFTEVNALMGSKFGRFLDSHSGLHSEQYLRTALVTEVERAKRYKQSFSIILVSFNSIGGMSPYKKGQVIQRGALALQGRCRASDTLSRWGDGLAVILPNTDTSGAQMMRNRIESFFDHDPDLSNLAGANLTIAMFAFPEDEKEITALIAHFIPRRGAGYDA